MSGTTPHAVERSILFPGGGLRLAESVALAHDFDDAGFHGLYCVEAYRSGFVPLTVLGQATSRCRVGTYIINAHARPPVAAAMAARDVDELTGGRVVVGVGSGNPHINEWHLGASNERPLAMMKSYVEGLKGALRGVPGETVEFVHAGREIRWTPAMTPVRKDVPVYLAAMYPKMRKLAGTVADGLALGSLHSADYIRDVIRPSVLQSVVESGREPGDFRFVASALTAVDADSEVARQRARRGLCQLFTPLPHPYYEFILREQGWSRMVDDISSAMREGSVEVAARAVPDEAVDALLIAGDRAECDGAIERFAGVLDEIVFADASSVGASIDPRTSDGGHGLRSLLTLAPRADTGSVPSGRSTN